ncbi:hypothetical protein [Egicoccus sp. AB-alg2]|uniref:hypothetical protein n=1 Tax=Egicoccus sp. AB-alg2 TaxID=3242693 RepID=UPI00359EB983
MYAARYRHPSLRRVWTFPAGLVTALSLATVPLVARHARPALLLATALALGAAMTLVAIRRSHVAVEPSGRLVVCNGLRTRRIDAAEVLDVRVEAFVCNTWRTRILLADGVRLTAWGLVFHPGPDGRRWRRVPNSLHALVTSLRRHLVLTI